MQQQLLHLRQHHKRLLLTARRLQTLQSLQPPPLLLLLLLMAEPGAVLTSAAPLQGGNCRWPVHHGSNLHPLAAAAVAAHPLPAHPPQRQQHVAASPLLLT
jgi:hypothetical protein